MTVPGEWTIEPEERDHLVDLLRANLVGDRAEEGGVEPVIGEQVLAVADSQRRARRLGRR
ncbi:MAG: hypothetical protein R2699_11085 [Acidimicrobiales bacterium]